MMTNLEKIIQCSLSTFENENENYYKPLTLQEWETVWDFNTFNPNIYNHGLHQYPARFIPQLARKILKTFTTEQSSVLDIFSGSGTTLLECKYLGIKNAYGIELNPFAHFMTKTKLQTLHEKDVIFELHKIKDLFLQKNIYFETVVFKNIDFWYSQTSIRDLSKLLHILSNISNVETKNFFLLAFAEITRKVSYLNHSGFKMHRSKQKIKTDFNPNVWDEFIKTVDRNINLLINHNKLIIDKNSTQILIKGDSRCIHKEIPKNSIDLILTSPPYGDSKTTVAYGQYSRLPWQWLSQTDDIIQLDNSLLGGNTKNIKNSILALSKTLKKQSNAIESIDSSNRIKDVIAFYHDLYTTLTSATYYMKKNGCFVLVTGNRTVKGIKLKTDTIISEFADSLGYRTEKIYSRNILNKRMAHKNSPTNKKGKTVSTMMTENIIVLTKI
ncbi:MAG TPA: DNA methyltransferase [Treponemataceae bacterium]|nr:DNA methyltransferase [Treponemataceae bacterium]HQC27334.1 DNA methyltransferase [Treponemataceae bacterium]